MITSDKTERVLLDLISKLGLLEWKRYQQRYPDTWVDGHFENVDHSSYPPFTSFRFKNEDPKIIEILGNALESYEGKLQWVMIGQKKEYGTGINRCILTKYIKELRDEVEEDYNIDEYVAKHEPDFAPLAYDDLISLTEHIKTILNTAGIHV